jgi:hypothetical protein
VAIKSLREGLSRLTARPLSFLIAQCIKGVLCINVDTSILGEEHSGPLGMVTIPLLHSLSGSAGSEDEILIALVGRLVLVLVLSLVLVGNKGERQDKDE